MSFLPGISSLGLTNFETKSSRKARRPREGRDSDWTLGDLLASNPASTKSEPIHLLYRRQKPRLGGRRCIIEFQMPIASTLLSPYEDMKDPQSSGFT